MASRAGSSMATDPHDLENSAQWRLRAEEMRTVADEMTDPTNQATARRLADDYDRLAEHAERHQRKNAAKQTTAK
jgi:hypothetical protein